MPRIARVVAVDVPHHITHRGNNRQDVFLSDEDRRRYQSIVLSLLEPCGVDLLGWCWMTNHVHMVAVPARPDSLARLIRRAHSRYAQEFNRRYRRCGHLWQSRYFSCALGPSRLVEALAYVDRNPLRAGMVGDPTAYAWSSAEAHVTQHDETGLLSLKLETEHGGCEDWPARLALTLQPAHRDELRQATQENKAWGSPEFVAKLEKIAKRPLTLRPRGRPPRQAAAASAAA